jgi:hypothetical protein
MLNFEKHLRTKNLVLRLIGYISGSISNYFLIKVIRAEDKNNIGRAKVFSKLFSIFEKPQNRWDAYYTAQPLAIKGRQEWTVPRSYKNAGVE